MQSVTPSKDFADALADLLGDYHELPREKVISELELAIELLEDEAKDDNEDVRTGTSGN